MLRPAPGPVRRWTGPAAGLSAGLSAAALLVWGLTSPALWLDESATVIAAQRSWPALWHLLQGPEAPLVPYYAVIKVVAWAGAALPAGVVPPEALYRLPSLAAAALAAGVLAAWLSRLATRGVVVAATGAMLLIPSFSRYGQEARPYAFALAGGVLATVAWSRLVAYGPRPVAPPAAGSGRRAVALAAAWYAAAVAALTVAHVLAASLVAAHLVMAAAAPGALDRRRALRRTVAGASAGLLLALPLAAVTWTNGRGPQAPPQQPTPALLGDVFFRLFAERQPQVAGAVVLLAAALLGLTRIRSARHGAVARIAAAWALVPLAVLLPVVTTRPNLMTHRYLLFVVPGWAILAGLGLVTIAELARRVARATGARDSPALRRAAVVALLAATAALQVAPLAALRGAGGHGEDIRPALRAAGADGRDRLPLVVSSRAAAVELAPYARADEARLVGARLQRTARSIWPVADDPAARADRLRDQPRVVLVLRGGETACRWRESGDVSRYITRCMPPELRTQGYLVVDAHPAGRRWTVALLARPAL